MQLQFTFDQLRLLFRVLEQDCRELRDKISRANDIDLKRLLTAEELTEEDLLEKVITRQLKFTADELDELAEVLRRHDQELRTAIEHASEVAVRQDLKNKRDALQWLLDKIVEACAML